MAELSNHANTALADVALLEGENIENVFEGDGFFLGANPIAKIISEIQALITTLTGGHVRVFLVITSMRVLMIQSRAAWCGCTRSKSTVAIATPTVKEAGIAKQTSLFCFHARLIHIQARTQTHTLVVKKFDDSKLSHFLKTLSNVIVRNG